MGYPEVDHGMPVTVDSMENSFLEDQQIPENGEIGEPISGKSGISGKKGSRRKGRWRRKKKGGVLLEGYVGEGEEKQGKEEEGPNEHLPGLVGPKEEGFKGFSRAKSLTDDDLDELKGCLDLGFGFSYDEIPELCNTLPALELCYSISQRFIDEQQRPPSLDSSATASPEVGSPIANWKISSPGDHPEEVKARLKFWAQAVACTVRLCS